MKLRHFHISLLLCAVFSAKADAITFADGGHHIIDADNSFPFEGVVVADGPGGSQTTLDVLEGGEVAIVSEARAGLLVEGRSVVRIFGGRVGHYPYGLDVRDDAEVTILGGSVRSAKAGEDVVATGNPLLRIEGGTIWGGVSARVGSFVHVSGGHIWTFTAGRAAAVDISGGRIDRGVSIVGATDVTISGGFQSSLHLSHGVAANITGGRIEGTVYIGGGALSDPQTRAEITGGQFRDDVSVRGDSEVVISGGVWVASGPLAARDKATITIIGREFNVPFGNLPRPGFFLIGTLADGNRFSGVVSQSFAASARVVPAPFSLIEIDIKPGSDRNSINPSLEGDLPVAILGSDSFDVADVDVTTLAFGPGGASFAHSHGPHFEEVDGDGFTDLLAHYRVKETGIAFGDMEACVFCEALDGTPLKGCDVVRTVPDMDGDALLDVEEATIGTDDLNPDTDEDGFDDGQEVLVMETDPLNPQDPTPIPVPEPANWLLLMMGTAFLGLLHRRRA